VPPPEPEVWPPDEEVVAPPAPVVPPLPAFPPLLPPPPVAASEEVLPLQATENPMTLKTRKSAVCLVIASPWCMRPPQGRGIKEIVPAIESAARGQMFDCVPLLQSSRAFDEVVRADGTSKRRHPLDRPGPLALRFSNRIGLVSFFCTKGDGLCRWDPVKEILGSMKLDQAQPRRLRLGLLNNLTPTDLRNIRHPVPAGTCRFLTPNDGTRGLSI
jgi:hypothetical protein